VVAVKKPKLEWAENLIAYVTAEGDVIDVCDLKITVAEKKRRRWGSTQFADTIDGDRYEIAYTPATGWQAWWTPSGGKPIQLPCESGRTVQASQGKAYRACVDHYQGQ
jgi:hypothetical protein